MWSAVGGIQMAVSCLMWAATDRMKDDSVTKTRPTTVFRL